MIVQVSAEITVLIDAVDEDAGSEYFLGAFSQDRAAFAANPEFHNLTAAEVGT